LSLFWRNEPIDGPGSGTVAAAAERAIADGLHVESDGDRKRQLGRTITLVKSGPAA
jgi:hypothetical protein